jgi:hypothetical protein
MALAARWLDPATIQRLRTLTLAGDKHAAKALRQLTRYRSAPGQSPEKRDARRAFERHAIRALDSCIRQRGGHPVGEVVEGCESLDPGAGVVEELVEVAVGEGLPPVADQQLRGWCDGEGEVAV